MRRSPDSRAIRAAGIPEAPVMPVLVCTLAVTLPSLSIVGNYAIHDQLLIQ